MRRAGPDMRILSGNVNRKESVMFKKFINKGLPMSLLLLVSAVVQGYAIRAFAVEVTPRATIEQVR